MLQLINVRKIYKTSAGDLAALDGINLTLPETGMVFITGKSGSGKTTMLNVIGGLDGIDEGEILVGGKKFSEFTANEYDSYRNTLVGFIFQEYNLLPDYSIVKNVGIANELQGSQTDLEYLKQTLASVGIYDYEGRSPNQLSGGQKQRVAIARALIKNPKIIMADEPTGALDSVTGIQVVEELKRLSKEKLVIVISHDLELANKYADRIIRLVDGKVVEDFMVEEKSIDKNVLEVGGVVNVKSGSELNEEETKVLLNAIKDKKSVKFTDGVTVKEKRKTDESKIKRSNENISLIKSKMKFKSAASLGVKSLGVKPLRLIFTILLSAIAFAVFGVFDTIASYTRAKVISNFLQTGAYTSIAVNGEYTNRDGDEIKINFSQNKIDELNSELGYSFRPVYSVNDFVSVHNFDPSGSHEYPITTKDGKNVPMQSKGKGYYNTSVIGVIEFKESERDFAGNITSEGYNLIAGVYPKIDENDPSSVYQVAISKYFAESIMFHTNTNPVFGKVIMDYKDLIGLFFKINGANYSSKAPAFEIVGVYDCGDIPEKFNDLKDQYVNNGSKYKPLADEMKTYLNASVQRMLFVADGAIEATRKIINKSISYHGVPALYYMHNKNSSTKYSIPQTFYHINNVDSKNVIMFDDLDRQQIIDENSKYTLKGNEVLVHIEDIDSVFRRELDYLNVYKLYDHQDEFKSLLGAVGGADADNLERENAIKAVFTKVDEIRALMATDSQLDETKEDVITRVKDIVVERESGVRDVTEVYNLKVVGVYCDVSERFDYFPLVVNDTTLNSLDIYTDQGYYSMAISKINKSASSSNLVANYITTNKGFSLNLYGNNIFSTLEKSEIQISKFTNLFLYAALVLALFSVFMLFNYISTSIASKRQSIGVLRALGSSSLDVFKMFITESLIISVISVILATGFSVLACMFVNMYLKEFMSLIVNFAIFGLRQVLVILGIGVFTGIISSIVPIINIAKEKPVDLIRRP